MAAYRTQMKTALDGLDVQQRHPGRLEAGSEGDPGATTSPTWTTAWPRARLRWTALLAFAKKQAPNIKLIINWAASTQVKHWMGVMDGVDGDASVPTWHKTYAASELRSTWPARTTCCSRCSPSISAPEAINDRLMLIETMELAHHDTPDEMLVAMTAHHRRPLGRRSCSSAITSVMDYELMGGDGRKTIISEMQRPR